MSTQSSVQHSCIRNSVQSALSSVQSSKSLTGEDSSPLRRALRTHFERFEGLIDLASGAPVYQESTEPIYKDTSNGNQF